MMVVVTHFIDVRWRDTTIGDVGMLVFNGNDAVSFFFVLSGFVLSYPYLQAGRQIHFWTYLKKRILRLYPAYWFTVICCFLYLHREQLNPAHLQYIFIENQGPKFWNEMTMVMNEHHLYFPGWTLRVEMVYSILIIPLIYLARHKKQLLWVVLLGSFFIGEAKLRGNMIHFLLGICLAMQYPILAKVKLKETKIYSYRWLLYLIIFVLFSLRHLRKFVPAIETVFDYLWTYNIYWSHFSAIAAYAILVLIIMSPSAQKFLETKTLLFLGKISYSIYLVHWVFVNFAMDYWELWGRFLGTGLIRVGVVFMIYVSLVVMSAHLMYTYIEAPFMRWSKKSNVK